MKSLMRSSAKSGCYQFPQQFRRNSQLKVQKPEQAANRNQHIYEIGLVICLVFLVSQTILHLACLLICCKATPPW